MKLRIERSIGETFMCYDIEGDVNDVLQVAEYVIADKEDNVTINNSCECNMESVKDHYRKWIAEEMRPGGLLAQ